MGRVIGLKRGDIVLVAGGDYAGKPRPAIVLQNDRFDATQSVTLCLLTSTDIDQPLIRVPVPSDSTSGIAVDSWAMIDKVTTVNRSKTRGPVGSATRKQLLEIERRLAVFLGIAE